MKIKKSLIFTCVLCISLLFGQIAYAGTEYSGEQYSHDTGIDNVTYYWHLSAAANPPTVPNTVSASGFGMSHGMYTEVPIDSIQGKVSIYKNGGTLIKNQSNTVYNSAFNSIFCQYTGWPTGASYCYATITMIFNDDYYGTYVAVDASTNLYK